MGPGTAVAVVLGTLAFVGGGLWFLWRVIGQWVAVWNAELIPAGGRARPYLGLNAVIKAEVPLDAGATLQIEQWKGREVGGAQGQLVVTVVVPELAVPGFCLGADGYAWAFARWAPRLNKIAFPLPPPLNEGRGEGPSWVSEGLIGRGLQTFGVYFVWGRGDRVTFLVPGGVQTQEQVPLLQGVVQLGRQVATGLRSA